MPVDQTETGAAVLEIERFEWVAPDRIEIVGYWSGLRGRRFMRPTLVLKGETEPRRLLALLDHKPWNADDGEEWIAAFAWNGEPTKFESADLNVGSGLDVALPPPRMRPGKPRRFRHRAVSRDATRDAADEPTLAAGIVSDPPPEATPAAKSTTKPAKPKPSAAGSKAPAIAKATPRGKKAPAAKPAEATTPDPEPTVPIAPVETEPAHEDIDKLRSELDSAHGDVERLRGERDTMRRERDAALEKVREVRGELEAERQARENAVADARAAERESATRMLAEGAELRAAVERQREIAYLERDDAKTERDRAAAARDRACAERDDAIHQRKLADRDRKEAIAERDSAIKNRDRAESDRARAFAERDEAFGERDHATQERDEIVSVHERGLPVKQPKPRFLPDDEQPRSDLEVWGPRGVAIGLLVLFAFIVLHLFGGL